MRIHRVPKGLRNFRGTREARPFIEWKIASLGHNYVAQAFLVPLINVDYSFPCSIDAKE